MLRSFLQVLKKNILKESTLIWCDSEAFLCERINLLLPGQLTRHFRTDMWSGVVKSDFVSQSLSLSFGQSKSSYSSPSSLSLGFPQVFPMVDCDITVLLYTTCATVATLDLEVLNTDLVR
jgi:hypothetical protein